MRTLPCSVGFPFSQLTSVNNFQLVPIDSPAALSPLLLMSETDESRGECERAGTELFKRPQSSRDVPVGHQHPSGAQRVWKFIEVVQLFWISILNIYTWTEEKLRFYYLFNGKSSSSSFFCCVPSLGFIFHSLHSIAKLENWLKWDKIRSHAMNYHNRVMIIRHLVFYVVIAWYFRDCIYLWVLSEVMKLLSDNIFPCGCVIIRRLHILQAGDIGGSVNIRTSSSLSNGQCNSWLLNKHDCQVCPQLFRRW